MKNEKGFNKLDLGLVKAFLKGEVLDYNKYKSEDGELNEKGKEFYMELYSIIVNGVDQINEKSADYIIISSRGNAGALNRQLWLTPNNYKHGKNIKVDLCICGNIECWGSINLK